MKKKIILLSLLLFFLFSVPIVFACQPCSKSLSLEETIEKAQFIIIGQQISGDSTEESDNPKWIEVKIGKILKGNIKQEKVKLASWYAMCPYGIINIDNGQSYMIFLEKEEGEIIYEAVDSGCSVKTLLAENDMVSFQGEKISLDEFTSRMNLQQPVVTDGVNNDTLKTIANADSINKILIGLIIIVSIIVLVFLFIKIKKSRSVIK